jgi:hypothetical protein
LQVLKEFLEGFAFVKMTPVNDVLTKSQVEGKAAVRVLAEKGQAYAFYVNGGTQATLTLDLPDGDYLSEWVDTKSGKVVKSERIRPADGAAMLSSPKYEEDIALRVLRQKGP